MKPTVVALPVGESCNPTLRIQQFLDLVDRIAEVHGVNVRSITELWL